MGVGGLCHWEKSMMGIEEGVVLVDDGSVLMEPMVLEVGLGWLITG